MEYYIYENWTRKRGRIHRGDCGHCNYGKGVRTISSDRNGKWHGPYGRDAAFKQAKSLNCADMRACAVCDP